MILESFLRLNDSKVRYYRIKLARLIFRNFEIFKSIVSSNFLSCFFFYNPFLRIRWSHSYNTSSFVVDDSSFFKVVNDRVKWCLWVHIEKQNKPLMFCWVKWEDIFFIILFLIKLCKNLVASLVDSSSCFDLIILKILDKTIWVLLKTTVKHDF